MKRFVFRPYLLMALAVAMVVVSAMGAGPLELLAMAVVLGPLSLLLGFLWPARWRGSPRLLHPGIMVPLCLAVIISVAWTYWPLRLEYRLLQPSIGNIVARIESGHEVRTPIQLGLLRVREVDRRHGGVCLWLDPSPGEYTGLARMPLGEVDSRFNLGYVIHLDEDWQYIIAD